MRRLGDDGDHVLDLFFDPEIRSRREVEDVSLAAHADVFEDNRAQQPERQIVRVKRDAKLTGALRQNVAKLRHRRHIARFEIDEAEVRHQRH